MPTPRVMDPLSMQELIKIFESVKIQDSGCWEWQKGTSPNGYGVVQFRRGGKWPNYRVHRVVYHSLVGDVKDLFVCHHCDNPKCANPSHLFLGTAKDNAVDAASKGRTYRGGANVPWTRAKTQCNRGHSLSGDNLSSYAIRRVCKICARINRDLHKDGINARRRDRRAARKGGKA